MFLLISSKKILLKWYEPPIKMIGCTPQKKLKNQSFFDVTLKNNIINNK